MLESFLCYSMFIVDLIVKALSDLKQEGRCNTEIFKFCVYAWICISYLKNLEATKEVAMVVHNEIDGWWVCSRIVEGQWRRRIGGRWVKFTWCRCRCSLYWCCWSFLLKRKKKRLLVFLVKEKRRKGTLKVK